jgi:hypothetical protein
MLSLNIFLKNPSDVMHMTWVFQVYSISKEELKADI